MRHLLHALVVAVPALAVHAAEAGDGDFGLDARGVGGGCLAAGLPGFLGPVDGAEDFCQAHFEVGGAVGGGLGGAVKED